MCQNGKVMNARSTCRDDSAPDCDICALHDSFSPCLWKLSTHPCVLAYPATPLPLHSLSYLLRQLALLDAPLFHLNGVWQAHGCNLTTGMRGEPRVGCLFNMTSQGTRKGGRDSPWQGSHSFHDDSIPSTSWRNRAYSLLHFSWLWEISSLFYFLTDFLDVYFNHTL